MAKKKASPKVPATSSEPVMRHARIELPDEEYQRLKRAANRFRLSVAGYIRMLVIKGIEADEKTGGK